MTPSSSRAKPLIVLAVIVVGLATLIGVLASLDSGSRTSAAKPSTGSGYITTDRTLRPAPEQDEATYFAGMRENWEASWGKSDKAATVSLCERWVADPITVLNDSEPPPDLPININAQTYRFRLGDFLMGKCGTPNRPVPSPSPSPVWSN